MNYVRQTRDRAKAYSAYRRGKGGRATVVTVEKLPGKHRPIFNHVLTLFIIAILAIVILIVGLAVGLNRKHRDSGDSNAGPPASANRGGAAMASSVIIASPIPTQNVTWDVVLQYNSLPGGTTFNGTAILSPSLFTQATGAKTECGYRVNNGSPGVVRVGYQAFDLATQQAGGITEANRLCGMSIRAVTAEGVSADGVVVGRCPPSVCPDEEALGMNTRTYAQLVGKQAAVAGGDGDNVPVTWAWL